MNVHAVMVGVVRGRFYLHTLDPPIAVASTVGAHILKEGGGGGGKGREGRKPEKRNTKKKIVTALPSI